MKTFAALAKIKQIINPAAVGIRAESSVHLRLPVSFFTVRRVVEQGQCIREKRRKEIAVISVQPFAVRRA